VLHFFAALPLPMVHFIGAAGGLLMSVVPNKSRRISLINIALCFPHKSTRWRYGLMCKSLMETGKTFAEFGPLWFWSKKRIVNLVLEQYDRHVVEIALKEGKGLLFATPHMGSWELSALFVCTQLPMTILYRPSRIPEIDPVIRDARQRFGAKMAPTNASGLKAIISALAKGETAGMLPDQEPKMGNGSFASFYGSPAYTPILISKLSARKKVPVVFVATERLPLGKGYNLHFMRAGNDIYNADSTIAAGAINRCVEKCINIAPEQYMWSYKRFRTMPGGSVRSYKFSLREFIGKICNAIISPIVNRSKSRTSGKRRRQRRR